MLKEKIVTHNGDYHADDLLAVSVVKKLFPLFPIERTRDEKIIEGAKIVIDVGNEYNVKKKRFDHHQKDFPTRSDDQETPYSSFGLVWKTFGRPYIKDLFPDASQSKIDFIWTKLDNSFVLEIDKNDTGKLNVSSGHFASIISSMNGIKSFDEMLSFADMTLLGITNKFSNRYDAKNIVEKACQNQIIPGVIELEKNIPWKAFVGQDILFAIFERDGNWCISTNATENDSMKPILPLLKEWRGLRNEQLSEASGIPGGVFVHNSGFFAVNETKGGALEMIKKTMNHDYNEMFNQEERFSF